MFNCRLLWQKTFIKFTLSCSNDLGQEVKMPEAGIHNHCKQSIQRTQRVGKMGALLPGDRESILSCVYLQQNPGRSCLEPADHTQDFIAE